MTKILFENSLCGNIKKLFFANLIEKRYNSNIAFLKKEVQTTSTYSYENIKNLNFNYDYYIAESDVIWDPSFRNSGFDPVFFLNLPGIKTGKKIVYSAGLGDANFSYIQMQEFRKLVLKLDEWSVRENYSKNYINNIVNDKNIISTLDPTLIIDDSYFKSLIGKRIINNKYILVYTPAFNNKKLIFDAYCYAKQNNYKVVIIKRVPTLNHFLDTKVNVDVEKFLNYLNYCEAFFCDSYHGVCLSVQLQKEFYVYERADGKKISDLCSRLGLEKRIIKNDLPKQKINYKIVNEKLSKERKKSEEFLDNCFK